MSDYMFMLESHLNPAQNRVLNELQEIFAQAGVNLFLSGGTMRDMLGGFPIRDLDFTIEGQPVKFTREILKRLGGVVTNTDELRRIVEFSFPGQVSAEIGMAREEKYAKTGARPQVSPTNIYEHLRGRDFTINAIALSLNRASRGLLLDPTNGVGDLERRELRTVSNYTLYDDPSRLLRLLRFKVRLSFGVDERTQSQYQNVREAKLETKISSRALFREIRYMAEEPNPAELMKELETENLLTLFSPVLTGAKINYPGLQKWQKNKQLIPFGVDFKADNLGLFLFLLTEKMTPKEKTGLIQTSGLDKEAVTLWQKLESRAKKLEKEVKSAKLNRPSRVYNLLVTAQGDEIMFLLTHSGERLVQDRIKNYLQKYLPAAQEVTDAEVIEATSIEPGTPKWDKTRAQYVNTKLDARPKKVVEEPLPEPVVTTTAGARK